MHIRTTAEHREQRFQDYLESTVAYFEKVEANGDEPWHEGDVEARRELFLRRHTRPEPPSGMDPIVSIKSYQR